MIYRAFLFLIQRRIVFHVAAFYPSAGSNFPKNKGKRPLFYIYVNLLSEKLRDKISLKYNILIIAVIQEEPIRLRSEQVSF